MKKTFFAMGLIIIFSHGISQQKEFEGRIVYAVRTVAKSKDMDPQYLQVLLAMGGDKLTIDIKNGNYKRVLGFKKIDTLYYLDYDSDTTRPVHITKSDLITMVNKYQCKAIRIEGKSFSTFFRYTNDLYINPEHDQDNTIASQNVFVKESGGGVWLYARMEYAKA